MIQKGPGNWIVNGVVLEKEKGKLVAPLRDSVQETLEESLFGKKKEFSLSEHEKFCLDLVKELMDRSNIHFSLYKLEKELSIIKGPHPPNILIRGTKIHLGSISVGKKDLFDFY